MTSEIDWIFAVVSGRHFRNKRVRKRFLMYTDEDRWKQYDIFESGKAASEAEVLMLEEQLNNNPSDLDLRIKLLGHYSVRDPRRTTSELNWFIQNDPYSVVHTLCARSTEFKREQAQELKESWLLKVRSVELDAYAFANAAELFKRMGELKLAKLFLTKAARLEPQNIVWSRRLFELYQQNQSMTEIANLPLIFITKNGERKTGGIRIGSPYITPERPCWRCPVAFDGLYPNLPDICGEDSFQSLTLAIKLIRNLVSGFEKDGGRLLQVDLNGEDCVFDSASYF